MAVSSTTAMVCIPSNKIRTIQSHKLFGFSNTISFSVKARRFCIRSSSDPSPSDTTTTTTEVDSESSIEVPTEPNSLISALNVEKALRGIPITEADHYGRLGIPKDCPSDKVALAYSSKVKELESRGLEEDELKKQLELLKESYTILSSEVERRIYDWSLARIDDKDRYTWPFEVDTVQISEGDPPLQDPEDVEPTRLVGYFILGWVALSFVLSIALNL